MFNPDKDYDPPLVFEQTDEPVVADTVTPKPGQLTVERLAELARVVTRGDPEVQELKNAASDSLV
jgi:hypothetical protein